MDSSSEDSFAWTDTSSDSIESEMGVDEGEKVEEEQTQSNNKNGRKRKLRHILNNISNGHEEENDLKVDVKIETEQSCDETYRLKKNIVKMEPESESEVPKKKKKKKKKKDDAEVEKSEIDEQESTAYDESWRDLDIKVKQENMCAPSPVKSKKKMKFKEDPNISSSEMFDNNSIYSGTPEENGIVASESDTGKKKKKKKKDKKERDRQTDQLQEADDEKIDVEEQISDTSQINNKSDIKLDRKSKDTLTESDTLQDETNCSEISAIQGDESHSLNTVTPNDSKSVAKRKNNDSLHKSTVLNQFKNDQSSQNIEKRIARISDRIVFEKDDDEPELHTNGDNNISSKLKECLKENSSFERVSQELPPTVAFSNDDEIWMVKCPKEIDVEALLNIEFNTDAKCRIKVCGKTYDGSLDDEQPYPATVLRMKHKNFEIINVPISGTINFRKRIPKAHFRYDNVMENNQTNFIPLPEIKCRHPLFGSNYKKAIKIPDTIAEKLNPENSDERTVNVPKQKKKKHKKSKSTPDELDETSAVNDVSVTKSEPDGLIETVGRKRKKRKHVDDESPVPKKTKKIKLDPESAEAWESEKAIEKTLFDF